METKIVKKFFGIADFVDEEVFLQKQHQEGWRFKTLKGLRTYVFERSEAKDCVYQLMFNENTKKHNSYIESFTNYGWEFVMKYKTWYYFRKKQADRSEPEEDNQHNKALRLAMCKKVYQHQAMKLFLILPIIVLWNVVMSFFIKDLPIPIIVFSILLVLLFLFAIGLSISNRDKLSKIISSLQESLGDSENDS